MDLPKILYSGITFCDLEITILSHIIISFSFIDFFFPQSFETGSLVTQADSELGYS